MTASTNPRGLLKPFQVTQDIPQVILFSHSLPPFSATLRVSHPGSSRAQTFSVRITASTTSRTSSNTAGRYAPTERTSHSSPGPGAERQGSKVTQPVPQLPLLQPRQQGTRRTLWATLRCHCPYAQGLESLFSFFEARGRPIPTSERLKKKKKALPSAQVATFQYSARPPLSSKDRLFSFP